jgi:DNA-binding ferritin-like protein (Dps family)
VAYREIKEAENERIKNLEQKYEQDMKTIRQQMSSMFTMLEK